RSSRDILGIYLNPNIPIDPELIKEHKGDTAAARDELLDLAIEYLWRRNEETEFLEVHLRSGSVETLYWKDLVSGALLKSVIERAKDFAIKRVIASVAVPDSKIQNPKSKIDSEGITLDDLQKAIR